MKFVFVLLFHLLATVIVNASDCPAHDSHSSDVISRGDQAMGFDHTKTTHHFYITPDGGVIEAESKDHGDTQSQKQIQKHFEHITRMFSEGNFEIPMFIHAQVPPGVPAMKQLKSEIHYEMEETRRGARIRITTKNEEAMSAIHEFLRFQIEDHKTGDQM